MSFTAPAASLARPLALLTLLALTGCVQELPTVDPEPTDAGQSPPHVDASDLAPPTATGDTGGQPIAQECEHGTVEPCGPYDTGTRTCFDGRWSACFGEQDRSPVDAGVAGPLSTPEDFIRPQAPLPFDLHHGLVVASTPQAVYAIGGAQAPDQRFRSEVYRASLQADGHLAAWAPERSLPEPVSSAAAVVIGDHLVVLANRERDPERPIGAAVNARIYVARIDGEGALGPWVDVAQEAAPSTPVSNSALFIDGRRLYVAGGQDHCVAYLEVRSAELDADGWFGPWRDEPSLPGARFGAAALAHEGAAWVMGGHPGCGQYHDDLLRAELGEDGLGPWQRVGDLGRWGVPAAVGATTEGIFFIGGDGGGYPVGTVGMISPWDPSRRYIGRDVRPFTGSSTQQGPFVYTVGAEGVFRLALPGCADGRCQGD